MNKSILERLKTRSVIVFLLVVGTFILAVQDEKIRSAFGDLAKIGVGGYLAQLIPNSKQE
jgi:hypothetical protein